MALYGKYRPKNFADVVGQTAVKTTLLHAAKSGRVSHAYLLCGTRGTGKTTSARILAKAINCENLEVSGDPCGKCSLCQLAQQERLTDVIEIDAASNRGIDDIRDLRDKVAFAPTTGKAKIYIIDEVHMLTKEAFNALLKTLEEPPEHAYFILATTEFHKVPETIRSRCQTFFFRKISRNDIVARLEYIADIEGFEYDRLGTEMIADRANGGLRDAISLLEQSASYGPITEENLRTSLGMISPDVFQKFFVALHNGEPDKCMKIIEEIQNEGRSIEEFGKDFLGFLREEFHNEMKSRDNRLPWILQIIDIFEAALQNLRSFEIPPLALEIAIAKSVLLQKEFSDTLKKISKDTGGASIYGAQKPKIGCDKSAPLQETEKSVEVLNLEPKKQEKKSPVSKYDDNDFFPEASPTPPWEGEEIIPEQKTKKKVENNIQDSDDFFTTVQSHWSMLCNACPTSIKLNLLEYGTLKEAENENITIEVSSPAAKSLLEKEKNLLKITEIFSEKLEKNIKISVTTIQEESKNKDGMNVEDVESMLMF